MLRGVVRIDVKLDDYFYVSPNSGASGKLVSARLYNQRPPRQTKASHTETTWYYRVDFMENQDDQTSYMPLLRNYKYVVTGQGFSTANAAAQAYTNSPVTASLSLSSGTNSGGIRYYTYGGSHFIGVTEKYFNVPASQSTQTIGVITNYYYNSSNKSWKVVARDAQGNQNIDWITLSRNEWNENTTSNYPVTDMTFTVGQNTTGSERKAYLHYSLFIANGVEMIVEVTQAAS